MGPQVGLKQGQQVKAELTWSTSGLGEKDELPSCGRVKRLKEERWGVCGVVG